MVCAMWWRSVDGLCHVVEMHVDDLLCGEIHVDRLCGVIEIHVNGLCCIVKIFVDGLWCGLKALFTPL